MKPVISIIMGSKSDWATMQKAAEVLGNFGVAYEKKVVSAHRTPDLMFKHAEEARSRGIKVIIAGAGGAAHLPGMVAAKTTLPVIGVPVKSRALSGVDSLYSIVQMPGGVPVATMAIGEAGATNAALFALRLLSVEDQAIATALADFAEEQGKIAEESTNELNENHWHHWWWPAGADDGDLSYLHGTQGYRLGSSSGLSSLPCGGNHRGPLRRRRCSSSVGRSL